MTDTEEECEHSWEEKEERIIPERKEKQPPFTGRGAYFTVRVCTKCKTRRLIDYKVEA